MGLDSIQLLVLVVALGAMTSQLLVKEKKAVHILFAVFCGSVAMATAKKLGGDSIGAYQYLIGIGACATCNVFWLLSRALFREKNAIAMRHLLFAGGLGFLMAARQGYFFFSEQFLMESAEFTFINNIAVDLIVMLSSCLLVLSFWEAYRGLNKASGTEKISRIWFLATYTGAVATVKIVESYAPNDVLIQQNVIGIVTLSVIISTCFLILYRTRRSDAEAISTVKNVQESKQLNNVSNVVTLEESFFDGDDELAKKVEAKLLEESLFLTPNLKVGDLAKQLDVPEYRISRVLKHQLNAKNFNHFVNKLRIEHAQKLLDDPNNKQWPVLVVGLESGFASVGPFTRAFKQFTGVTPNQYRQHAFNNQEQYAN